MKTLVVTSVLMFASAILSAQSIVPCEIVVPLLDSNHNVVAASAPDGHSYPVFQASSVSLSSRTQAATVVGNSIADSNFTPPTVTLARFTFAASWICSCLEWEAC